MGLRHSCNEDCAHCGSCGMPLEGQGQQEHAQEIHLHDMFFWVYYGWWNAP